MVLSSCPKFPDFDLLVPPVSESVQRKASILPTVNTICQAL